MLDGPVGSPKVVDLDEGGGEAGQRASPAQESRRPKRIQFRQHTHDMAAARQGASPTNRQICACRYMVAAMLAAHLADLRPIVI